LKAEYSVLILAGSRAGAFSPPSILFERFVINDEYYGQYYQIGVRKVHFLDNAIFLVSLQWLFIVKLFQKQLV
jgi:hypothetical protein